MSSDHTEKEPEGSRESELRPFVTYIPLDETAEKDENKLVRMGIDRNGEEVWENSIVIYHQPTGLSLFPAAAPMKKGSSTFVAVDLEVKRKFKDAQAFDAFFLWVMLQDSEHMVYGSDGLNGAHPLTQKGLAAELRVSETWIKKRLKEIDAIVGLYTEPRYEFMTGGTLKGHAYFVGGQKHTDKDTYHYVDREFFLGELRNPKKTRLSGGPAAKAMAEWMERVALREEATQPDNENDGEPSETESLIAREMPRNYSPNQYIDVDEGANRIDVVSRYSVFEPQEPDE